MIHPIGIIIALLIALTSACHAQDDWQFADDFADFAQPIFDSNWQEDPIPPCIVKINAEESRPIHQVNNHEGSKSSSSLTSGANARRLINGATVGYALINMYPIFQELNTSDAGWYDWAMTPKKRLSSFGALLGITCKALLYKTMAQCILSCVEGDFIDFVIDGFKKVAHHAL